MVDASTNAFSPASSIQHLTSSVWWARRDSNPQPLPCKGSRLPLTYVPVFKNQFEMTASRRTAIVRKSNEEVKTCSAADCHGSAVYVRKALGLPVALTTLSSLAEAEPRQVKD